jgi:hypothetical protein
MDNSLKKGAIAGLVAGLIAGIVMVFIANILPDLGLSYYFLEKPEAAPLVNPVIVEIANNIIWGIFLGIIFSKIYDLIPGKGVFKGLLFGLAYYAFLNVRFAFFMTSYNQELIAISAFLYIHPIVYGLVLGGLYRVPEKKIEISKHDKMWGFYSGVFAAIVFAIFVIVYYIELTSLGMKAQPLDIEYLIFQQGTHIVINMFWFGIFGALYAMLYDRIPGKNLMKGLYVGLIFWAMMSGRLGVYFILYGWPGWAMFWGWDAPDLFIIWGIMLDAFYNKRAHVRAFLISIVILLVGIIEIMVESTLPQDYFIITGIVRVIVFISLPIFLVKIGTRSMEKATG